MMVIISSGDAGEKKKKECLTQGRLSWNEDGLVMGWIWSEIFTYINKEIVHNLTNT